MNVIPAYHLRGSREVAVCFSRALSDFLFAVRRQAFVFSILTLAFANDVPYQLALFRLLIPHPLGVKKLVCSQSE